MVFFNCIQVGLDLNFNLWIWVFSVPGPVVHEEAEDDADDTIKSVRMRLQLAEKRKTEIEQCLVLYQQSRETICSEISKLKEAKDDLKIRLRKAETRENSILTARQVFGPKRAESSVGVVVDLVDDFRAKRLTREEFTKELESKINILH